MMKLYLLLVAFGMLGVCSDAIQWPVSGNCEPCSCQLWRNVRILRYVNCSARGLDNIPKGLPSDLDEIDLSYNRLTPDSIVTLQDFTFLRSVSLAHNNLLHLRQNTFENCTYLQHINLEGNTFSSFSSTVFQGRKHLRSIQGLDSAYLPENVFHGLKSLKNLQIVLHHGNVPEELFHDLAQLQTLHLTVTTARSLPAELFSKAGMSLANLELIGPSLETLHENTFRGLSLLKRLILRSSSLRTLPNYLLHSPDNSALMPINLQEIVIDGARSLPRQIFNDQISLRVLTLNKIEDLPSGLFKSLETLDSLDISNSNIYSISPNWFVDLASLRKLNVSNSRIRDLQKNDTFAGLRSLTSLDLSNNNIDNIHEGVFQNFEYTLESLNVSGNFIKSLNSGIFRNMMYLKHLDLSNNKLSVVSPDVFSDLHQLTDLYMQDNKLTTLSSDLLNYQFNLQECNLATNLLTYLPKDLLKYTPSLLRLDISNNRISEIPEGFLDNVFFLEDLVLLNNPLHCDCSVVQVKYHKAGLQMYGRCTTPPQYIGMTIQDFANQPIPPECVQDLMALLQSLSITVTTLIMASTESTQADITPTQTVTAEFTSYVYSATETISTTESTQRSSSYSEKLSASWIDPVKHTQMSPYSTYSTNMQMLISSKPLRTSDVTVHSSTFGELKISMQSMTKDVVQRTKLILPTKSAQLPVETFILNLSPDAPDDFETKDFILFNTPSERKSQQSSDSFLSSDAAVVAFYVAMAAVGIMVIVGTTFAVIKYRKSKRGRQYEVNAQAEAARVSKAWSQSQSVQ